MTRQQYYLEAINSSLDEMDCFDVLNNEQKQQLAKDIETSVDCIGQAFYSPAEYGVDNSEVKRLKERIKELEKEVESERMAFKKNVARRNRWDVNEVWIDKNGDAGHK